MKKNKSKKICVMFDDAYEIGEDEWYGQVCSACGAHFYHHLACYDENGKWSGFKMEHSHDNCPKCGATIIKEPNEEQLKAADEELEKICK